MGSWMLDFDYISYILLDYGRLIDDTHFDRYIFVIYNLLYSLSYRLFQNKYLQQCMIAAEESIRRDTRKPREIDPSLSFYLHLHSINNRQFSCALTIDQANKTTQLTLL